MSKARAAAFFIFFMTAAAAAQEPRMLPGGYKIVPVPDGGAIRGQVVFEGEVPELSALVVTADRAGCGDLMKPNETLLLGPGRGIANCLASLESVRSGKAPTSEQPPVLDQQQCVFTPHVMAAQAGRKLIVHNSDPVYHNVHAYSMPGMYTRFNVGQPIQGAQSIVELGRPELLVVRCDAGHRWMNAYVYVTGNPYWAISARDGTFAIDQVPPGKHKMRLWHETIGEKEIEVEVPAKGTVEMKVTGRVKPVKSFTESARTLR